MKLITDTRMVFIINFKAKFLLMFLFLVSSIFSKEINSAPKEVLKEEMFVPEPESSKPELRLIGSIYTVHTNDNDIYNNNTNLIGLEYRPIKDFGISVGYFKNSFDNDSYLLSVGKYLRPSERFNDFYFTLGVGIVKGYRKENYIYQDGEIVKRSKFNTNVGGDYIIGANLGLGYDITDYFSINVSYVGAFVSTVTLKLY